jgi:hypothetical protein
MNQITPTYLRLWTKMDWEYGIFIKKYTLFAKG